MTIHRRNWLRIATVAAVTPLFSVVSPAATIRKNARSLFVMDTGLRGPDVPDWETRAKLAKDLGFRGIGVTLDPAQLGKIVEILDRHSLEVSALYTVPGLEDSWDEKKWSGVVRILKDRPTRIELALVSRKGIKLSDPSGDPLALELIRRLLDLTGEKGPVYSIYPHRGSWAERTSDGVRLAKQINDPRFGTHFNLIHTRWVEPKLALGTLLDDAKPFLKAVTINGIANGSIVPLGIGNEDLSQLLKELDRIGYQGPIGLQGYGIPGKSADHLGKSMAYWKSLD